ncbi:MAG: DEAD/DEAH box helicase, partial [Mangrovibacterium sp.]
MLSLQQAIEIKESLLEYIKATYHFQDKNVQRAFYDFITDPVNGMFKGPYVSLKLPFVTASPEEEKQVTIEIKPGWTPYDHQVKAWQRLSTVNQAPKPAIITTGTGSGKTESFMFPVLDYCYRNLHRPGIKVIILYPMNALATDQAQRFAKVIYEDKRLKDKVTAGLFIGEGVNVHDYPKAMGQGNIIENRETILASPPDILLTNFKMLDYALMKSNYHALWLGNLKDRDLLRFLVLDELHTYDGAQGTDVANLIRRLKLKLGISKGHLCPVGTSATMGSGDDAPVLLSEYASRVFGEEISPDCLITENRISVDEYFNTGSDPERYIPRTNALRELKPVPGEEYDHYIDRQITVWQLDRNKLAADLKKLRIVADLVSVTNSGTGIHDILTVEKDLSAVNEEFRQMPQWNAEYRFKPREGVIHSLFSLIAEARQTDPMQSPFLFTQTQLWVRELSGIFRVISENPAFSWKEDVDRKNSALALPPWFCRECGASGWIGIRHDHRTKFENDLNDTYLSFFNNRKDLYFFNCTAWFSQFDAAQVGYEATDQFKGYVDPLDLEFYNDPGEDRVNVTAFRKLTTDENGRTYNDHVCPECNSRNTVSIIGARVATLSSIGISQTMSTDLDKQTGQQRKILAFANSVQDAAHQAGFIQARNYRFTFRASLQKVINRQPEQVDLSETARLFVNYWKDHSDETMKQPLDAYYYRLYPADYVGESEPPNYGANGKYEKHFQNEFDQRMVWEIFTEFGYNAMIGRTLEKTGSSGVYFEENSLKDCWTDLQLWLHENDPSEAIREDDFLRFLHFLLHRVRIRGAISHPYLEKFRNRELKLWDLNWNKDRRHYLNHRFGKRSRLPRLITSQLDNRSVLDTTFTRTNNWFHSYFKKCFILSNQSADFINEFYRELIAVIYKRELIDRKTAGEMDNYALNPKKLLVSNKVYTYTCNSCGHEIHVGQDQTDLRGGHCLNFRCTGIYDRRTDRSLSGNYYQMVYNRSRSPRIYSADHTGLLPREKREELEDEFKNRPHFDSENVLVATSTLEMGIDIGALNAAYNHAVPPLASNFLQRVGRAGRTSGSALVVNYARKKAHDLYYFREPMEMMAGQVHEPGCYLEAREILKRHFFAYCIDTWTSEDYKNNNIPATLKYISLKAKEIESPDFFMNRILGFIKVNEQKLLSTFGAAYENEVSDEIFEELEMSLIGGQFFLQQRQVFEKLVEEIEFISEKEMELTARIKGLNLGDTDPGKKELLQEVRNLKGLIKSIRERNTIEHLTNVGSIPNYAFPEKGVILTARVMGKQAIESTKPPTDQDFEIVRPASQALREFAPDNLFYSQGFKFLISGINTFDWSDEQNFHQKRFCSNCDHIEISDLASGSSCPKCGHESWGASSNKHVFARLLSVKSFNTQSDAALQDDKEEPEHLIYHLVKHFSFKNATSKGAWAMTEIPFGIEFVRNVTLTETNLGRSDVISSRKVRINDREVPAAGFITCRHCGKSSAKVTASGYKFHYGFCKYKDEIYQGTADDVFEEAFLFREIQTEALKILLPVQEFNSDAEIKMFRAGIELGLKNYFRGNPQHLQITEYREFNSYTGKFDQYLVLYDAVPGGTGYLEKLFDRSVFKDLLNTIYKQIKDCGCQHQGKDGCYHCIFSYGNQNDQADLSRKRAEKRFEEILQKSEGWELLPHGLGSVTKAGQVEESELELRFIRCLRNLSRTNKDWSFEEVNEMGTISYLLHVHPHEGTKFVYSIKPQMKLGPNEGVAYFTRTDFLITCIQADIDGGVVDDLMQIRRIAVYLDGYQYHASDEHNRFLNDFQKRAAINRSPEYSTWTLTWADIEQFEERFLEDGDQLHRADFLELILQRDGFRQSRENLLAALRWTNFGLSKAQNN